MDYLTASQAAQELAIDQETLRRYEVEGKLPFMVEKTPGGHRRYPADGIKLYKASRFGQKTTAQQAVSTIQAAHIELVQAAKDSLVTITQPVFEKFPNLVAIGFHDPLSHHGNSRVGLNPYAFDCIVDHEGELVFYQYPHQEPEALLLLGKAHENITHDIVKAFEYQAGTDYDLILTRNGEFMIYTFNGDLTEGGHIAEFEDINFLVRESNHNAIAVHAYEYGVTPAQYLAMNLTTTSNYSEQVPQTTYTWPGFISSQDLDAKAPEFEPYIEPIKDLTVELEKDSSLSLVTCKDIRQTERGLLIADFCIVDGQYQNSLAQGVYSAMDIRKLQAFGKTVLGLGPDDEGSVTVEGLKIPLAEYSYLARVSVDTRGNYKLDQLTERGQKVEIDDNVYYRREERQIELKMEDDQFTIDWGF